MNVTTFATDERNAAIPLAAADLDAGPRKVVPDLSPSRLGARAYCEGYGAPPMAEATYLEVSNRPGANLLAYAAAAPQTAFTMAALSSETNVDPIDQGTENTNIAIGSMNLGAFDSTGLGEYDFITAADVFSTAATAERMALLVLVKKHLSDKGVACIGLDVSPGWELIEDLKTRFCDDLDAATGLDEQVALIRTRVTNLAKTLSPATSDDERLLRVELTRLARASDAEIYRDLLDPHHQALSIEAFLAMADAAKLKPIGDIDPAKSNIGMVPADARPADAATLAVPDLFGLIDKHRHTKRRHVLLVHDDRTKDEFDLSSAFSSLRFTSELARGDKSVSDKTLLSGQPVTFVGPLKYRTSNPIEIVALALMERHKYFPVEGGQLVEHVVAALKPTGFPEADSASVSKALLSVTKKLLPAGAMTAHLAENSAVSWLSKRPVLSPLALKQARRGDSHLTSLLPHSIAVDETARFILGRLDGIQSLEQIVDELAAAVAKGELTLAANDGTPEARAKATTMRVLGHAARSGLLIS
eukprot:s1_g1845.t1